MKYMKFMNLIEFRIVYHSISNHTFTQDVYMFFFFPLGGVTAGSSPVPLVWAPGFQRAKNSQGLGLLKTPKIYIL